jgi:hypothetical protein
VVQENRWWYEQAEDKGSSKRTAGNVTLIYLTTYLL